MCDDKEKRSQVFWSIFAMQLCGGLLVVVVYLLYVLFLSRDLFIYSLIWAIWVIAEVVDVSWFFYSMEEFKAITTRNLIVRVGVIVAIFCCVHRQGDLYVYCLLQAIAFAINSLILLAMMCGQVSFAKPALREVLVHVKPNLVLFAPVISITIYTQLNTIIKGNLCNMKQVAFYDNSYKIIALSLMVVQSLGTVMLPRMSNVISNGDTGKAKKYLSSSFWVSQGISIAMMFGIISIAPVFTPVFFGPGFEECAIFMSILALMIPVCGWSNVLGLQYLIPKEKDVQYLISVVCGAAVNILLCVVLITPFGTIGAAVATTVAELAVTFAQIAYTRKALPLWSYAKEAMPFILIGVVELVIVAGVGRLLGTTLISLICEVVVGVIVFVGLAYLWLRLTHNKHFELIRR
ncbi:polysaccharide biosynthesis C-terminal domain-containing protein [Bifidobacterium animalis]|nr:polysaccharide biosynthesis C-terminal domain-containing protein [Bifidobacterium animalis]ANU43105.1 hypothetical protein A4U98_00370 [Bifidobacterium animalis subsp. animalis]PHQ53709.1 hypothetical protein ADH71_005625 [Bifidobacterium animalis subsp. animalis]QQQ90754.1 polysaccharide biosynthesis C-terminal domain-containing protein [Bifidobacterium animalis]UQE62749.1 polysaccharide biosynthesis C-terminal domain-containing protein [Bifidobacterium animalis]